MAMNLSKEIVQMVKYISQNIEFPEIKDIYIPGFSGSCKDCQKNNFGAIQLQDGSTGIFYTSLSPEFHDQVQKTDLKGKEVKNAILTSNIIELALDFESENLFEKTIALGALNAISHHIFKRASFVFDPNQDLSTILNLNTSDMIGMVGFFPPLVKKIEILRLPLVIIELKPELVRKTKNWEITLQVEKLRLCTKVVCTSTTILNDSLDHVLANAINAEIFALLGPTAGLLPDPLFSRNVNIIGGTLVQNPHQFFYRVSNGIKWGDSAHKFLIYKENYKGYKALISSIS
jgi:uncharacterized protein (DUF4213/DUF364 family)